MQPFDDIVQANRAYVAGERHRDVPVRPSRALAVVTCMDSRVDPLAALGLDLGEAHVIRTGGARVTDDVLRSLTLSAHALGTRSVAVIGHTDCGLADPDGTLVERLTRTMGRPPTSREWGTFATPSDAVSADCELLSRWSDRPDGFCLAGYVLDIRTGELEEIVAPRRLEG